MLCLRIVPEWKKNIIFSTNPPGAFSFIDHLTSLPPHVPRLSFHHLLRFFSFRVSTGDSAGDRFARLHRCENGAFVACARGNRSDETSNRDESEYTYHFKAEDSNKYANEGSDIFTHPVGSCRRSFEPLHTFAYIEDVYILCICEQCCANESPRSFH